jgi:uncharacterized protein
VTDAPVGHYIAGSFSEVLEMTPGMLCPNCKIALVMSERQSIEIDYCPQCRGVWLDRGELDKIIERSAEPTAAQPAPFLAKQETSHHGSYGHKHPKRRKSFLEELFD